MKLQKQSTRKVGEKEYFRYTVVVPPKVVKALGWQVGDELRMRMKKGRLVVRKKVKEAAEGSV